MKKLLWSIFLTVTYPQLQICSVVPSLSASDVRFWRAERAIVRIDLLCPFKCTFVSLPFSHFHACFAFVAINCSHMSCNMAISARAGRVNVEECVEIHSRPYYLHVCAFIAISVVVFSLHICIFIVWPLQLWLHCVQIFILTYIHTYISILVHVVHEHFRANAYG